MLELLRLVILKFKFSPRLRTRERRLHLRGRSQGAAVTLSNEPAGPSRRIVRRTGDAKIDAENCAPVIGSRIARFTARSKTIGLCLLNGMRTFAVRIMKWLPVMCANHAHTR
jgi:hypothetical protein